MGTQSAQRQANLLKDKGNFYFKKEKLGAAIDAYTEAITLCPSVPLYWTNRAICERRREEWEKVEADCRKALELDSHCVKAYYLLGLALVHYQQYEEGIYQLKKAMALGRGAEGNYIVEEIWQELAKARFAEWEAVSDLRQQQQLDLKVHLSDLLQEDYKRELNGAIASIKAAAASTDFPSSAPMVVDDLIRFDSGSNNNSEERKSDLKSDLQEETTGGFNFLDVYPELNRLSRAQSEPPSVIHKSQVAETKAAFDPLRQHKLSHHRSGSSSIRRQRSNLFSLADSSNPASPSPATTNPRSERNAEGNDNVSETASSPVRRTEDPQTAAPAATDPETMSERNDNASETASSPVGGTDSQIAAPAAAMDPEIKSDAPVAREDPPSTNSRLWRLKQPWWRHRHERAKLSKETKLSPGDGEPLDLDTKSDEPARDVHIEDPPQPTTAPEQPPAAAPVESTVMSTVMSTATTSSDGSDVPLFHSIYDVFKVFKDYMKLHQNEAGQKLLRLSELYQRRSKVLEYVFEKAAAPDKEVDIPDHLCCKITMDIFRDPVISTSGITYERAAILDHLRKVGSFDPTTRAPLVATQLVSNLAIRDAVEIFLDEHGWAYRPC